MSAASNLSAPDGVVVTPLDVRDPEVVAALADAVAILDGELRPRMVLHRLGGAAGIERPRDATSRVSDFVHRDDRDAMEAALQRSRNLPDVEVEVRVRVHNDVEGWHPMTLLLRNLLAHPDVQGILVRAVDLTTSDRDARWRALVGASTTGMFEIDVAAGCTFVNPAFEALMGVGRLDALGDGWTATMHADDLAVLRSQFRECATGGSAVSYEVRVQPYAGVHRWVRVGARALRDSDGRVSGFLGTIDDITDRKALEERLLHDQTHDRLTGLAGRALLAEELNAALAHMRRGRGRGVAVLFIDLDGFKRVNDMLGHAAGDELLVQVAQRLRDALRGSDICARLGADEFVVGCRDVDGPRQAAALAERLLATINDPYDVHGHDVLVGASIGIAVALGDDPVSVEQLVSNADVAVYRAKRAGRGRIEVFDEGLRRELTRGRQVARAIGRVLDEPRVPILCTPIVDMAAGAIVGFDCHVDWEAVGVRERADIVDAVAEDAGLARSLDVALVRTLLGQLAEWERQPPAPIVPGLALALSRAGALSPILPELVRDMVARTGVAPELCWIGLPETAVDHDFAAASRVAAALDDLGVGVALRDFGSVVSSLEQLRRLPTPTMTLAGQLVDALRGAGPADEARAALLAAVVQYARALGRIVVAFDVQDATHAAKLREIGCDFGSGPAFGAPIRPDEIAGFLARADVRR